MFESSHPFALFDYFRVPYTMPAALGAGYRAGTPVPLHRLCLAGQPGPARRWLLWPAGGGPGGNGHAPGRPDRYRLRDFSFFGNVVPDSAVAGILAGSGRGWRPAERICDAAGRPRAAIWQDDHGDVFLPFDPGDVMRGFWSEGYQQTGRTAMARGGRTALLRAYYLARPVLPRQVQLRLRHAFTRVQARSVFPRWPLEDSLHALYAWLFGLLAELAGRPVPFLAPWPDGRTWALVLTHDVETAAGCQDIELLRAPERELGYQSSWNFVPLRYQVADSTLRALQAEGCEVGVHGLRHDGRDIGSRRLLAKRLPVMREYAGRWQAAGFRSPGTLRRWDLMPQLGFDYDSSYSDTDPYEPQPGGCCSYLPFFNESMVELPITLPQDHTMFAILQLTDAGTWLNKAQLLRERQGMVLALTHPDYARDPRVAAGYRSLLQRFRDDETAWHALPREVATWWRQRACSALRRDGDGWRIEGPAAASGRIGYATASGFRSGP